MIYEITTPACSGLVMTRGKGLIAYSPHCHCKNPELAASLEPVESSKETKQSRVIAAG